MPRQFIPGLLAYLASSLYLAFAPAPAPAPAPAGLLSSSPPPSTASSAVVRKRPQGCPKTHKPRFSHSSILQPARSCCCSSRAVYHTVCGISLAHVLDLFFNGGDGCSPQQSRMSIRIHSQPQLASKVKKDMDNVSPESSHYPLGSFPTLPELPLVENFPGVCRRGGACWSVLVCRFLRVLDPIKLHSARCRCCSADKANLGQCSAAAKRQSPAADHSRGGGRTRRLRRLRPWCHGATQRSICRLGPLARMGCCSW
jgi:hypothetical protein